MYTGLAKLDTGKEKAESWNGPTYDDDDSNDSYGDTDDDGDDDPPFVL